MKISRIYFGEPFEQLKRINEFEIDPTDYFILDFSSDIGLELTEKILIENDMIPSYYVYDEHKDAELFLRPNNVPVDEFQTMMKLKYK